MSLVRTQLSKAPERLQMGQEGHRGTNWGEGQETSFGSGEGGRAAREKMEGWESGVEPRGFRSAE